MGIVSKFNNCFSVRFQNLNDFYDPRTADMVIDSSMRKEFFELTSQFELITVLAENDVWHIFPADSTNPDDITQHISTWDIMYRKYLAASNSFREMNKVFRLSAGVPTVVVADKLWFA